ncbi:response regulator [Methylophilus luteus]|uniref:Response regulator n=1 Tax=Methylophilus luteus TaxID=640108 RepID=A0ABW3F9W9_9PROT
MSESAKFCIVVVEDEEQIRRLISMILEAEDFIVYTADTGKRGLIEVGTRKPDIAIIDLGLPDMDGVELIQEIRVWGSLPIIVLSARTNEVEKVRALDAGADDYITKPFGSAELLARVRAHLRRRNNNPNGQQSQISFGEVKVDFIKRQVLRNDVPVSLTPIEYRLLTALLRSAGCVLTQRTLLKEVWGPSYVEHAHYLRIYMGHLRNKLERDPAQPRHLLTEIAVGYRIVLEP